MILHFQRKTFTRTLKMQRDLLGALGIVSGKRTLTEDAHGLAALGERGGE